MATAQGDEASGYTHTTAPMQVSSNFLLDFFYFQVQTWMASVGTIIDQMQLWQCWSKKFLFKVFEDDSGQTAEAQRYLRSLGPDNLRSDCFLWCSSYAKHKNSNRFEVCWFSFQPSQSNICLLKSMFPAWITLMCSTRVSCSSERHWCICAFVHWSHWSVASNTF